MIRFSLALLSALVLAGSASASVDAPTVAAESGVLSVALSAEGSVEVEYWDDAGILCSTDWFRTGHYTSWSWSPGDATWYAGGCSAPIAPQGGTVYFHARFSDGTDDSEWSNTAAYGYVPPPPVGEGAGGGVDSTLSDLTPTGSRGATTAIPVAEDEIETPAICGDDRSLEAAALADSAAARALSSATAGGILDERTSVSEFEGFTGCPTDINARTPAGAHCVGTVTSWIGVSSNLFHLYSIAWQKHFCYKGYRVYEAWGTEWSYDRLSKIVLTVGEKSHSHVGGYETWIDRWNGSHDMRFYWHLEGCALSKGCVTDYTPRAQMVNYGNGVTRSYIIARW